jgi:hypothetical protein
MRTSSRAGAACGSSKLVHKAQYFAAVARSRDADLDFSQLQNLRHFFAVLGVAHADLDQGTAVAKPAAFLHDQIMPRADQEVGAAAPASGVDLCNQDRNPAEAVGQEQAALWQRPDQTARQHIFTLAVFADRSSHRIVQADFQQDHGGYFRPGSLLAPRRCLGELGPDLGRVGETELRAVPGHQAQAMPKCFRIAPEQGEGPQGLEQQLRKGGPTQGGSPTSQRALGFLPAAELAQVLGKRAGGKQDMEQQALQQRSQRQRWLAPSLLGSIKAQLLQRLP